MIFFQVESFHSRPLNKKIFQETISSALERVKNTDDPDIWPSQISGRIIGFEFIQRLLKWNKEIAFALISLNPTEYSVSDRAVYTDLEIVLPDHPVPVRKSISGSCQLKRKNKLLYPFSPLWIMTLFTKSRDIDYAKYWGGGALGKKLKMKIKGEIALKTG